MTTIHAGADTRVRELLRDAAAWRLLGLLFECPGPAWRADVEALAREIDEDGLCTAAAVALTHATEGQYHSVFGPGGPAPPREVSYRESLELGSLMAELVWYYDAFGYRPATRETPDHVAVEVGFIAYLRLKAAYATACGEANHLATIARASSRFIADHLATMAGRLAELLAESDLDYLAQASQLLADRVGPPPACRMLPVVQPEATDDTGSQFECAES